MSLEAGANEINSPAAAGAPDGAQQLPQKKKQKRNKPTLSCEECVERKTKVGVPRGRIRIHRRSCCEVLLLLTRPSVIGEGLRVWHVSNANQYAGIPTSPT